MIGEETHKGKSAAASPRLDRQYEYNVMLYTRIDGVVWLQGETESGKLQTPSSLGLTIYPGR